jgi:mxaL protein
MGADTRLVFFSDGQQFPPETRPADFDGKPGEVGGLIVGVGGAAPVPIPRLDKHNQPVGFWEYVDLRDFLPPDAMPQNPSSLYLSHLDEPALTALATVTGLSYLRLETPAGLAQALLNQELATQHRVAVDIRWILALLALGLFLATRLPPFRWRKRPACS